MFHAALSTCCEWSWIKFIKSSVEQWRKRQVDEMFSHPKLINVFYIILSNSIKALRKLTAELKTFPGTINRDAQVNKHFL